jgi:hypothetical protein
MDSTTRLRPKRRVLCIEWLDPLYFAGHWVPQLVHAAGGKTSGLGPVPIQRSGRGRKRRSSNRTCCW